MSTRADDDSWDIATGVGTTAVGVAAARAAETATANPLISDPFAAVLIGTPELAEMTAQMTALSAKLPEFADMQRHMMDFHGARTHYFDDFFTTAADAGIRQYVILASGLDSRAFRLSWPANATVYEIDQPPILEYKSATLAAHGATPGVEWRTVGIDLRHDWPKALQDSGFEPSVPTAWSAEGLLSFLPGDAQDALFERIDHLSAGGSRVAVEAYRADGSLRDWIGRQNDLMRERATELGTQNFDAGDLWYGDEGRTEPADWLEGHGWHVRSVTAREYMARLDRPLPDGDESFAALASFLAAERG